MQDAYKKFIQRVGQGQVRIERNKSLAPYTTFKIGGPADLFVKVIESGYLVKTVNTALDLNIPFFILGGGSNILVSDQGFAGLVILNRTSEIKLIGFSGGGRGSQVSAKKVVVLAESGAFINSLVRFALNQGLVGLEHFLGLPGTVGGAIWGNAHFKAHHIGETVVQVNVLTKKGKKRKLSLSQLEFDYDSSRFKKSGELILDALFSLKVGNTKKLWRKAEENLVFRQERQPLDYSSAGCIFQNLSQADLLCHHLPFENRYAGFLIDSLNLKDKSVGDAQVSFKHANFIVNRGKARASDVYRLILSIEDEVFRRYGVKLKREINLIGQFEKG